MKKFLFSFSSLFLFSLFFLSCGKKESVTVSSGQARLTIKPAAVFAEPNQKLTVSGAGFSAGEIAADSLTVDGKNISNPKISISADGSFPETGIFIPDALKSGKKDITFSGLTFTGAVEVQPVTIEYMMWGLPDERQTVEGYIKKFEELYPDIKIKIILENQGYDDKLKTMFAAHTPPDIMYMGLENFPSFADKNVFHNLDEMIARDKLALDWDDFYKDVMEPFRYKGSFYGIAKDFTTLVMYYNRDLFDKEKIPYPDGSWTWKEFLAVCRKLTKDTTGDGTPDQFGFVLETWFQEWAPWLWANGGEIMNPDRTRFVLGAPEYIDANIEALQFLKDLVWTHKVAPNPSLTGDMGTSDMFKTGKIGMCTYGRWMCMQFKHITDFKWDVAPFPGNKKKVSVLFDVCYAIASESKHKEAAWLLMKYLMSKEGQTAVAESGHAIPARRSIANSPAFLEAKIIPQKINSKVFLDAIPYSRPTPTNPFWNEINTTVGRDMDYIFRNMDEGKDIRKVLTDIQKKVDDIFVRQLKK